MKDQAELQWRLSIPLAVLTLTLLAVYALGSRMARPSIGVIASGFVAVNNQVVLHDDDLKEGASVGIFQRAFGG